MLYPFQRKGADFLLSNNSALLADEPGLGKTLQAITAIDEAANFPCLILCPSSMKQIWCNEFNRWIDIKVKPDQIGDITITNYERLPTMLPKLKEIKWEAVVCDESHYLKNQNSLRSIKTKELTDQIPNKILMTGTPVLNKPVELISQLKIMGKMDEFGSERKFLNNYCSPFQTRWGWDYSGASNLQDLNDKLKNIFLRRTKENVAIELPSKTFSLVPFQITNRIQYLREEQAVYQSPNGQLARIEKLRVLAMQGKVKQMIEWIQNFLSSGEKLVCFLHHSELQEIMKTNFPEASTLFGGQTALSRQNNMAHFQYGDTQLIFCSLQVAGVGLTLTAAHNICFLEYPWTPGLLNQAIDRVHRITQDKPVNVYYLYGKNTIEQDMLCILENKEVVTSIIQDGRTVTNGIIKKMMGVD